jgi:lipopolysaccharide biosynthesis regulator YciM
MKNIQIIAALVLFIIAGCKTPVNLVDHKNSAETAMAGGDYQVAAERWELYFSQYPADNELEGSVYAQAAQAAFQANKMEQAIEWFDQARLKGYDEPSMQLTLADIYNSQGNVSKELAALEEYKEKSPKTDPDVNSRLFSIYYTTKQQEKALEAWNGMADNLKGTEENLDRYFTLNKQLKNEAKADSASLELLKVAPEHVGALEWHAQKNYEKGEARYQREMKAYEARPTTGNYQTLLRGLKAASVIFRKSLDYFEKLWEVNPDDRGEYAVYMNNIHVRFNDKEKADTYRKYID